MPRLKGQVYFKMHRNGGTAIAAICDENLLDKRFSDGRYKIDVSRHFYGGDKMPLEEALVMALGAGVINMVGKHVIRRAVQMGIVHPDAIMRVAGIPHAIWMEIK